jgi:hypothetical protein
VQNAHFTAVFVYVWHLYGTQRKEAAHPGSLLFNKRNILKNVAKSGSMEHILYAGR